VDRAKRAVNSADLNCDRWGKGGGGGREMENRVWEKRRQHSPTLTANGRKNQGEKLIDTGPDNDKEKGTSYDGFFQT